MELAVTVGLRGAVELVVPVEPGRQERRQLLEVTAEREVAAGRVVPLWATVEQAVQAEPVARAIQASTVGWAKTVVRAPLVVMVAPVAPVATQVRVALELVASAGTLATVAPAAMAAKGLRAAPVVTLVQAQMVELAAPAATVAARWSDRAVAVVMVVSAGTQVRLALVGTAELVTS